MVLLSLIERLCEEKACERLSFPGRCWTDRDGCGGFLVVVKIEGKDRVAESAMDKSLSTGVVAADIPS